MVLLSAITASFLTVFLAAFARHERRRETAPLIALIAVLTALVVRGGLNGAGLLPDAWALDIAAISLFAAVPFLLGLYAVRAYGATSEERRWWWLSVAVPATTFLAFGGLSLAREPSGVSPIAWQAFAVGLQLAGVFVALRLAFLVRSRRRIQGIRPILGVFGIHWVCSGAAWISALFFSAGNVAIAAEAGSLITLVAFGATVLVAAIRDLPGVTTPVADPRPYARSGLDAAERVRLAQRLDEAVRGDKLFLDSGLNAASLAEQIGLSQRELSEVLNVQIGSSFFEFVNRYRVDEAARRLADPAQVGDTVLEILFASGFNSKSAFHRAFREKVGKTPSAFRREQRLHAGQPTQARRAA